MYATPYVASLRIYEPLASFSELDQNRWEKLSADGDTRREEQISALRRLVDSKHPEIGPDGAHLIIHNCASYISPWSTAHRCRKALKEFSNSLPSSVIPLFFPDKVDPEILEALSEDSLKIVHVLTETWIIPPRWFALFSPEERSRGQDSDGAFTVLRTEMSLAKKRCIATHQVVREAFGPGPVEEEMVELLNWLNHFDPDSIVECDYGGLATYLEQVLKKEGSKGLDGDTSIEDVHLSIEGLASGDAALAGRGYEKLLSRWRKVAAFEQAM